MSAPSSCVCSFVRHHGVTGLEYTVFEVYYWPRAAFRSVGSRSVVSRFVSASVVAPPLKRGAPGWLRPRGGI